jgi:hypothetical protein
VILFAIEYDRYGEIPEFKTLSLQIILSMKNKIVFRSQWLWALLPIFFILGLGISGIIHSWSSLLQPEVSEKKSE